MRTLVQAVLVAGAVAVAGVAASGAAMAASLAVGKKIEVNVDAAKMNEERAALWAKYGGWCSIKDWHPAVASCVESKEGADTFRTLTFKDGGVIKEKLLESRDNLYKYAIVESPLPVKNFEAQFALTPDDDDLDEINFAWSAVFDPDGKPDKEARGVIDGIIKAGMDNIAKMTAKPDDDDNDNDKHNRNGKDDAAGSGSGSH